MIRVEVVDGERLHAPGNRLIVANHPSLIDAIVLGSLLPQLDLIMSSTHAENSFLAGAARAAGYLRNDGGPAVVAGATERLQEGRRLLTFPEGTRTPLGEKLGPFRRGAARIALGSGCDLVPVALTMQPRALTKGQPWTEVPDGMHIRVRVLEPISAGKLLTGEEPPALAARKITSALRERYEEVLDA